MNIVFNEDNITKSASSPLLVVEHNIGIVNNKVLTLDDEKLLLTNEEEHILKLV